MAPVGKGGGSKGKAAVRFDFTRQFQESIIRMLFQDPDFATGTIDKLDPEFFEEPHHRWVAKTIYWAHRTLDAAPDRTVLLNEAVKEVKAGVIREEHVPLITKLLRGLKQPVANKGYIAAEVENFCRSQLWKHAILKCVDEHMPSMDFQAVEREIEKARSMTFASDGGVGSFFYERYKKRQRQREKTPIKGITTGTKLDAYTKYGGLPLKTTAAVLAATGRGKTNWLIDRTFCALEDDPELQAVYYSLELPTEMIEERMDARASGIPIQLLNSAGGPYIKKMKEMGDLLAGRLVVKEFTGTVTKHTFLAHLKSLERLAFYPKMIIMDWDEYITPTIITTDPLVNQGQVLKDLDALAKERNALVWTAMQGNRKSMEDEVSTTTLAHTQGSIKKPQLLYFVVALSQTAEEKKAKRMRAGIEKNRFGAADVEIQLKVDHGLVRFRDV